MVYVDNTTSQEFLHTFWNILSHILNVPRGGSLQQ